MTSTMIAGRPRLHFRNVPISSTRQRGQLQRKCACGRGAGAGNQCDDCRTEELQRKANSPMEFDEVPPSVHDVLRGSGWPLDSTVRSFMEPRFVYDFSHVRIHTDATAARSAEDVRAHAYTVGANIVFGANKYVPSSTTGLRLLAHELTHVVQQQSANKHSPSTVTTIGDPRDSSEKEAETISQSVAQATLSRPAARSTVATPVLQRFAAFEFIGDVFRKGPIEALGRLFGEGEFSKQELQEYLSFLDRQGKSEGRYDSDNKARAIVRLWKTGDQSVMLTARRKALLVREMWEGSTTSGDAEGILDILVRSKNEDIRAVFGSGGVTPKKLFESFPKGKQMPLRQFFDRRFKGGFDASMRNQIEPVGALSVAPYLNDQTFRESWNAGLSEGLTLLKKLTSAGQCAFPRPDERRIDEANWSVVQLGKDKIMAEEGFAPQRGTPFEAIGQLFANLDQWTCDCRLFPEIAMLYAWRFALTDSPEAFNAKFADLRLRLENTTGLERTIIAGDDERAWQDAPVGTKVVWTNSSPAAKTPWKFEHGIKSFKGEGGKPDLFAAHPLGYDLTENEVKEKLAQNSSDYPWIFQVTANSLRKLTADGVAARVVSSLRSIQGKMAIGMQEFLNLPPLARLRQSPKKDINAFNALINNILRHARQGPSIKAAEEYVAKNIHREKIEIPK